MPVTEYLMKPGRWDLTLVENTPARVLEQIKVETFGFAQLIITPARVDPRLVSDADMMSMSRYTGLYRRQDGRTQLSGGHINLLLGDEDNKGDVIESPITTANGFLSQWFTALANSDFPTGTVTSPGGWYTDSFLRVTRRQAWDTLCAHFGVEWRISPRLSIDVATAAVLYGTTPKLVVLRDAGAGGRDQTLTGLQGTAQLDVDVEDFTSKVILLTGAGPTATTASGANPYTNPAGGPLVMDRLVDNTGKTVTAPAAQANAELAKYNQPRYALSVSPDVFDVGYLASVGSPVYVYDPLGGTYDTANVVQYRGRTIFPVLTRVMGLTWPIQRGMGVYLRRHNGTAATWVDLSPYVQWENRAPQVEVGAIPRPSR